MPRDREPNAEANESERKQGMPGSGSDRALWRPPSWSRSPLLHEWIRSGTVLIAAVWGVYTFIFKDIYVPSQQPAHLSLEASLKPVPDRPRPTAAAGLEMLLEIKATNASSRRVYLLANIWKLREMNAAPRTGPKAEREFIQELNGALKNDSVLHKERGVERSTGRLIASGRLLGDDFIDPGNTKNRSILVNIPTEISAVELSIIMPLLSKQPPATLLSGQRFAWEADALGDIKLLLCPKEGERPSHGNSKCREYELNDDEALKQFDPLKAIETLDQQIGLPISVGN
jgi:hypothetical protein